jgi:GDP-L-fucose synthase
MIGFNLLKSSLIFDVYKFINLGSACIYPKEVKQPIKEEYLLSSQLEKSNEGYAIAKIATLKYAQYIKNFHKKNFISLQPANLYGPKDNFDPKSSHLIAAIIQKIFTAIKNKESSIEVWGDGSSKREFLYIDDFAEFVVNLLKSNLKFPDFLNIGYGTDLTIKQYYKRIINLVNPKIKMIFNKKYPAGMKRKLIDSSLAKKIYRWSPKTSLNKGLIKTIKYYENNEL